MDCFQINHRTDIGKHAFTYFDIQTVTIRLLSSDIDIGKKWRLKIVVTACNWLCECEIMIQTMIILEP